MSAATWITMIALCFIAEIVAARYIQSQLKVRGVDATPMRSMRVAALVTVLGAIGVTAGAAFYLIDWMLAK